MESLQNIKARRNAVKNIGQITKAMEVVSATKMRKSQEVALRSRVYGFAALSILRELLLHTPGNILASAPFVAGRAVRTTLLVVMVSDRGLAGAFNSQLMRAADAFLAKDIHAQTAGHTYKLALVGKKAFSYGAKKGLEIVGSFEGFGDYVTPLESKPIADLISEGYTDGRWDRVVVVSTHFRTTLRQEPLVRELLPLHIDTIHDTIAELVPEHGRFAELRAKVEEEPPLSQEEYIFEPSPERLIAVLMPHLVSMQLYQLLLEANASEHSARRVAMKSASDNASELGEGLLLLFNKARQAGITKEMTEISSAIVNQ
ncbi:MAG: ATP synthase F1 subunit gamma [Patescibacteria group bacterium]